MATKKSTTSAAAISDDEKWKIERDLNTCMEYHRIKKDPKRMAAVRKLAKEQMAALKQHTEN